jgi:hypothetical protein
MTVKGEAVPKIHIVILSEAKNLLFFLLIKNQKKRSFGFTASG